MNKLGFTIGDLETGGWMTHTHPQGGSTNASGVKINNPNSGVQYGVTTLDKVLSTILSGLALTKGAGYIPTTQQPQQEPQYVYVPQNNNQNNSSSGAGKAAEGLEKFIQENSGLLLVAGVGVVLFMSGRK